MGMAETVIGVVVRPFGIRGELKVKLLTDVPERFEGLAVATLARPDGSREEIAIAGVRHHQGHVLLRLRGVDSVETAETLRGAEVRVPATDRQPTDANTYYTMDLVGMRVRLADGSEIGRVSEVLRYPAQDLLVVGEALIPAVRAIVTDVDTKNAVITIDPPDGLLPESMLQTISPCAGRDGGA